MSRHVCMNESGGVSSAYQARCACGFVTAASSCDAARLAYEQHVKAELGDMATYEAPVVCINCSFRGPASIPVGMDVWGAFCPMCGTSGRLRPEEHHDERNERARSPFGGWF